MANLINGQAVKVPALVGGGTTKARFVKMERKVQGRRWVTFAMVRYTPGGALFPLVPSLVRPA